MFDPAENPKDGSAPGRSRWEKRRLRRVRGRRAARKRAVRRLLARHGLKEPGTGSRAYRHHAGSSVWDLRRKSLAERLTGEELARVLFHIAKRRGYQARRKAGDPGDVEGKKALEGAERLKQAMAGASAPTIGAYLAGLPEKRNSDGGYDRLVTRDLLRDEVARIFKAQRSAGNRKAAKALEAELNRVAFAQRPLKSWAEFVGFCSLEPRERRAPRFSYSAELFAVWSKLNNTRVLGLNGEERRLRPGEKAKLAQLAHQNKGGVTYEQARKALDLDDDQRFNIGYRRAKKADESWEEIRDSAETTVFLKLPGYHALKTALDTGREADWKKRTRNRARLDEMAAILSFHDDPREIDGKLATLGLNKTQRTKVGAITGFSRTVNLSLKAIRNVLPAIRKGMSFEKACKAAGYRKRRAKSGENDRLPPFEETYDPVANRALSQLRKVLNAVLRVHGMPETILVEVDEDVGVPFRERKDRERQRKKNKDRRTELRQQLEKEILAGHAASREELMKYMLWKEQQGFCIYSGEYIPPELLRDPLATRIDHILPFARSWDDSYLNKVLCLTHEANRKGSRTPCEYLGATERWEGVRAIALNLPRGKAGRVLMQAFDRARAAKWKKRRLTDNRYIARLVKAHLVQNLALEEEAVETRNGALSAHLRGAWGFPDKERRNDRHLALAALLLASATEQMVDRVATWNQFDELVKNPGERPRPPLPWKRFHDHAKRMAGKVFVSRMPVRKVTGAAHEETIRSLRRGPQGERQVVQRVKLRKLTPALLDNLVDRDRNHRLHQVLKEKLDAHGGNPEAAFAEPVRMPVNAPGREGPLVQSVRVMTGEKSGVRVNGGLASNGDMIRVDVFRSKGRFHLVPVYAHHFAERRLPNKAITADKPEDEWEEMEDKNFLFSLYRNDLVRVDTKSEKIVGYYTGTHRGTGAISIRAHDRDPTFGKNGERRGIGTKTLPALEKYAVDYFGNRSRIVKETRMGSRGHIDPGSTPDVMGTGDVRVKRKTAARQKRKRS